MNDLSEWMGARRPTPPMSLEPWLGEGGAAMTREALTRRAIEALAAAEGRPGRDRAAAFDLLAADALLTYACEAALDSDAPDAELGALFQAVVEG